MKDHNIIDLFFAREEAAIRHTDELYGKRLFSLADNILRNRQDAEESVNDTYLTAWNTIPPQRPGIFSAFLAKVTRHIAIDRWRRRSAQKRGGGEMVLALEELSCCASPHDLETQMEQKEITRVLDQFLASLPETERNVFLCRYWYLDSIQTIADRCGFSRSKTASMLHRTRGKLRQKLESEGLL